MNKDLKKLAPIAIGGAVGYVAVTEFKLHPVIGLAAGAYVAVLAVFNQAWGSYGRP
jgi:tetrahydromethanopterin S-methyltransferase subunit E